MKKVIKSLDANQVVSLYDNKIDTAGYYCGKVQYSDDSYVLLSHFNQSGMYSGYILLKTDNVYRVDRYGQYENKIEYLASINHDQHKKIKIIDNAIKGILQYACDEKLIIVIELCGSDMDDLIGFVSSLDDNILTLDCCDDYGRQNGTSSIYIDDITAIKCDTNYCNEIKLMANRNE